MTHVPILILHGQKDSIVPYAQGLELFEQAHTPKKMIRFSDKGHTNLWDEHFAQLVIKYINSQNCDWIKKNKA